jgi:hypothetical protein
MVFCRASGTFDLRFKPALASDVIIAAEPREEEIDDADRIVLRRAAGWVREPIAVSRP